MRIPLAVAAAAIVLVPVTPVFGADKVEVPCEDHELLTGQTICDSFTTITWDKARWEAEKAKVSAIRARQDCEDAVWGKYAALGAYGIRRTTGSHWAQDPKPDDVADQRWISCSAPRLWNGKESFSCYEELEACKPKPPASVRPSGEVLKLWD